MEGQGGPAPKKRAAFSHAAVPGVASTVPGGTVDRLIRLPDRVLLCILLKVGTKQAVKMGGVSRQWRRVWTRLPVLEFDGVDSSVPARALAAYQAHGEDDIHSLTVSPNQVDGNQTTAWLSLAAPLLSGRLRSNNRRTVTRETLQMFLAAEAGHVGIREAFELPCFKKATEILMDLGFLALKLPLVGVFDALRVMWLEHFWLRREFSITGTMFPSLQELTIRMVRGLTVLTLDSKSLVYIRLSFLLEIRQLHILAPGLDTLEVTLCFYDEPQPFATIAAERLKVLRWEVPCVPELRKIPHLLVLGAPPVTTFWSEDIYAEFLDRFPAANHLELQIRPGVSASSSYPLLVDTIFCAFTHQHK
jgi:hypothetical protein